MCLIPQHFHSISSGLFYEGIRNVLVGFSNESRCVRWIYWSLFYITSDTKKIVSVGLWGIAWRAWGKIQFLFHHILTQYVWFIILGLCQSFQMREPASRVRHQYSKKYQQIWKIPSVPCQQSYWLFNFCVLPYLNLSFWYLILIFFFSSCTFQS